MTNDMQREAFEQWCRENKIELMTKNWQEDDLAIISIGKIFSLHKVAIRYMREQEEKS